MSTSRSSFVGRGHVLRAEAIANAPAIAVPATAATRPAARARGRVLPSERLRASDEARATVERAREEAARIVAEGRAALAREAEATKRELRAEADARIAAALLAVRAEDERRAERDRDRLVQTAVVLAERLVGAALEVDPARIGAMAQAALREARGARRITFESNPLDAEALRAQLESVGFSPDQITIEPRDDLARGDLVLRTELGTLDARLQPQLQRLQGALSRAQRG